MYERGGKL
jgi:dynein heavy chain